jgi:hypothetical protein
MRLSDLSIPCSSLARSNDDSNKHLIEARKIALHLYLDLYDAILTRTGEGEACALAVSATLVQCTFPWVCEIIQAAKYEERVGVGLRVATAKIIVG